ncbi:MAG: hypothetical protein ACI9BK_000321 [Acidimicrobiales bacterium]|jgi:hypothetical protein
MPPGELDLIQRTAAQLLVLVAREPADRHNNKADRNQPPVQYVDPTHGLRLLNSRFSAGSGAKNARLNAQIVSGSADVHPQAAGSGKRASLVQFEVLSASREPRPELDDAGAVERSPRLGVHYLEIQPLNVVVEIDRSGAGIGVPTCEQERPIMQHIR